MKQKGIKNNRFFLVLYDKDLAGVDPYDPRLSPIMKQKILRECMSNFWYFIRECIRIKDEGGAVGSGKRYNLHRGNLALNFGLLCNWNLFVEFPRQHGKTISAVCYYLWLFNFGTTNSNFMFINKKFDDSKLNLKRLHDMRENLPSYLRMDQAYDKQGKRIFNKPLLEMKMNEEKRKNRREELEEQICLRGLDTKGREDFELIREH